MLPRKGLLQWMIHLSVLFPGEFCARSASVSARYHPEIHLSRADQEVSSSIAQYQRRWPYCRVYFVGMKATARKRLPVCLVIGRNGGTEASRGNTKSSDA